MGYIDLLEKVSDPLQQGYNGFSEALIAVVKLHEEQEITLPNGEWGSNCVKCDGWVYPCPTIWAIQKEIS
jgi:hypothetical protein